MRILYGVNSQGNGHLSKAAVLVPELERRGHVVRVISSGPPPSDAFQFSRHRHLAGLPYVVSGGVTKYGATIRSWLRGLPQLMRSLCQVRRIVQDFEPELILSDFELLTASPALGAKCEVIALSRQVTLFDREIPLPEGFDLDRKLARSVIRLFTCGADRKFGYHYQPSTFRSVPPIVRPELFDVVTGSQDYYFVYNHFSPPEDLVAWADQHAVSVKAYGFHGTERGRRGRVEFCRAERGRFLQDLGGCRAAMVSAGLTTPLEAFLLGKGVVTVPIPNQWEQIVNAFHLEQAGLATASATWNYDLLFEAQTPTETHPLHGWLRTPPSRIIDMVLDEAGGDALPTARPNVPSAA